MEEDFVRECPGTFVLAESVLVDALRRWRDWVSGGLDRSFFTGSESVTGGGFGWRPVGLCNPPVVGLLMFARDGGGRIEALLIALPVALGGRDRVETLRGGGLGSRLGDWPVLSTRETVLPSLGSVADRSYLLPASAGLRRDRVLEGSADIVIGEVVLLTIRNREHRPFCRFSACSGVSFARHASQTTTDIFTRQDPSLWHKLIDMIYASILQLIIGMHDWPCHRRILPRHPETCSL